MSGRLSRARAMAALKLNAERQALSSEDQRKYRRAADGLSVDIRVCGLGPALAMLLAEKDEAPKLLFDDLAQWLLVGWPATIGQSIDGVPTRRPDQFKHLVEGDQPQYRLWRGEALEFAGWLKRLARAFLAE
jgi:hypothetical protein